MASSSSRSFDEYRLNAEVRHNPYCVIHSHSDNRLPAALRRPGSEQRWERVRDLGHGSFGVVWLEELRSGSTAGVELRAIKSVPKAKMRDTRELAALTEFSRQKHVHTRSFVKFLGWFEDESHIYIAMEYFRHGNLSRYISTGIPENEIRQITGQLLDGLIMMHEEGYAHRDIKPDNIFVESRGPDWSVKIGDFGISKRARPDVTALRTTIGTQLYEAPEIRGDVPLQDEEDCDVYTNAVDMWSLGCVVYEMAAAARVFPNYPFDYKKLCWGRWYPGRPPRLSQQGWDFIKQILVPDPDERVSAENAMSHHWIQQPSASEATEKRQEATASFFGDAPQNNIKDFEQEATPKNPHDNLSAADSVDRTTNRAVDNPGTTIRRRKTLMVVVSSETASHHTLRGQNTTATSLLSALIEHVGPETARTFILIYAPGLKQTPRGDPAQTGEVEGMTPLFRTMYAEGLALVEKETMIMPFSTPTGYVHLARHISPDVAYIQGCLSGPDGDRVHHISGWIRRIVIMVSEDREHSSLIDSDDETTVSNPQKWWQKEGRTGIGGRIDFIDELHVGVDWRSRVREME